MTRVLRHAVRKASCRCAASRRKIVFPEIAMLETNRHPLPLDQVEAFCRKYGVSEFSLFGSILRDDFSADSDVDVLVTLEAGRTLTPESYLDMRDELSAMFGGREIDLVQKRLLTNPFRRQEILATRRVLYAA